MAHNNLEELLTLLRCPTTKSALALADDSLLSTLNKQIADGQLVNALGQRIAAPFTAALVNADETIVYPVVDGIPVMIPGEAIERSNQP